LAARGLKTKIAFNVALLLLLSAVITDILVVVVLQSVMVRDQISRSRHILENVGRFYFSEGSSADFMDKQAAPTAGLLLQSLDSAVTVHIVDGKGTALYQKNGGTYPLASILRQIDAARKSRQTSIEDLGHVWALFWWHPSAVCIAVPVNNNSGLPDGVVAGVISLRPIYKKLRKYHNLILLYILINTAVLTVVGLYRIFRLYLRPIDRIVLQADGFQEDGDLFFAFRHEDNELNRLSASLNRMLTRISSDKKKLQATVGSLEQANIELKNAQKEIIRAEKMASVGRLAAGIAHEIGNPIGIALGYLEMLKQPGLDDEDQLDFLARTENEVQRINAVIRQLLDLARPRDVQSKHMNVNAVISDIVEVMRPQPVMNHIDIESHLDAANDSIWGNDDQLRQVFLNLLLNAADAIHSNALPDGGRIAIRTSIQDTVPASLKPTLCIRFEDNGAGIDADQLQNIFDPFYTTKEPGKGTGLGLAVSYMIIESIGGTIRAEIPPKGGAVFIIQLPLADRVTETGSGNT